MTDALFASDALPLAVGALLVAEALALSVWMRRTGRRAQIAALFTFLASGAAFAAALYFHRRTEGGATGFALAMMTAFAMHVWHVLLLSRRR